MSSWKWLQKILKYTIIINLNSVFYTVNVLDLGQFIPLSESLLHFNVYVKFL